MLLSSISSFPPHPRSLWISCRLPKTRSIFLASPLMQTTLNLFLCIRTYFILCNPFSLAQGLNFHKVLGSLNSLNCVNFWLRLIGHLCQGQLEMNEFLEGIIWGASFFFGKGLLVPDKDRMVSERCGLSQERGWQWAEVGGGSTK